MSMLASRLTTLVNMGFSQNEALEALCITDNKGVEGALEVLVTDDKAKRKKRREEAVLRQQRSVNSMGSTTAGGPPANTNDNPNMNNAGNAASEQLSKELSGARKLAETEKAARLRSEGELKQLQGNLKLMVYKEYLRGVIADETITVQDSQQLSRYRETNKISQQEHDQIVKELGLTPQKFEEMKKFKQKTDVDCVVCLDKPKDQVVFNCMHLCMCEGCGTNLMQGKSPKCPLCGKKITKLMKIFNS